MNILVTGAGSLIGHGILRSLREIKSKDFKIFTADPDPRAAGHWLGDFGVKILLAKDTHYIEALKEIIDKYDINVVFVGTDPELLKISNSVKELKTIMVVSHADTVRIADNKWETVQFLMKNGYPYPDSALADDDVELDMLIKRVGFPLIAKPTVGARSQGVFILKQYEDIQLVQGRAGYIVQELLAESTGEFTAGTMTYHNSCYSTVIFRRELKEGNTFRAYSFENREHEDFLEKVSCALPGAYGPINFQYRIRNNKPVIFEINSRFSGTTPLRSLLGVNEIEMALEFIRTGTLMRRKALHKKVAIFRTWSDIIIPIEQVDEFMIATELPSPSAEYFPFLKK